MIKNFYDITELQMKRKLWIDIPVEAIPEKYREIYISRKKAVDMYIDGEKIEIIEKKTGVNRTQVYRSINKCVSFGEDTLECGYFALIPYTSIKKHTYSKRNSPAKGCFAALLEKYPELREFILGVYFGEKKYTISRNLPLIVVHNLFLNKCKELGIQDYEYPFNTDNKGYVSMCTFIKSEVKRNPERAIKRVEKDVGQKYMSTGTGIRYSSDPVMPFQRVQIDGHIIDLGYNIQVDNRDGTFDKIMATRLWLIAVIDVRTRCILGYSISQEFNYNQFDVLEAIKNAITPHEKMLFTVPKFKYPENGGFPSLAFPETEYALFTEIMLDNAKSHCAKLVQDKIINTLHCSMDFGSVATPETRGIVERFFNTIESKGFHQLPGTTGSSSDDPQRDDPENNCIRYDITYEEVVEFTEVLIAEYNNKPHDALRNETPLKALERVLKNTCLTPPIADETLQESIDKLTHFNVKRKVIGGLKNGGRRGHVNFEGVEYRNNVISSTDMYCGKSLTLVVNPSDLSSVEAFTEKGEYLGVLTAQGEWGKKGHSLKTRKAALKLARKNKNSHNVFDTPLSDYLDHLMDKAKKNRRAATQADIVRSEMGLPKVEEQQKNKAEIININLKKRSFEKSSDFDMAHFTQQFKQKHGRMPTANELQVLIENEKKGKLINE